MLLPHIRAVVLSMLLWAAPAAWAGWTIDTVDGGAGMSVGQHVSAVIDPWDNQFSIAYYDSWDGYLQFVHGLPGSWSYETVETEWNVGQYASLSIDTSGNRHIVYYDASNSGVNISGPISYHWAVSIDTVDGGAGMSVGQYVSAVVDPSDNEFSLAYYDSLNDDLIFAHGLPGSWTYETVETEGDVGQYASLSIDTLGNRHIVYYDASNSGVNISGPISHHWSVSIDTVDGGAGMSVGQHVSAVVDPSDNQFSIAYYDSWSDDLLFAHGLPGSWSYEAVDTAGNVGEYSSLDISQNSERYIAYRDGSNAWTKVASSGADPLDPCIDHSPQWTGNTAITYSLDDDLDILDSYAGYEFGHAHAGNMVAEGKLFFWRTNFTLEDELTPDDYENELFLTSGRPHTDAGWERIPWAEVTNLTRSLNTNGTIESIGIDTPSGYSLPFYLFRYLHFEPVSIDSEATRAIVLVHGANPDGVESPYSNDEPEWQGWKELKGNIEATISGSDWDWQCIAYDWHRDSSTGGILGVIHNAPEAAEIGHQHGQHLGESMLCQARGLEKVQFIAHSAGAWVARSAARYLTQNGVGEVQVTLLDPFVPYRINSASVLDNGKLDAMELFSNIYRLENYYVVDETDVPPAYATSQEFLWNPPRDINLEVDLQAASRAGDEHEDPIYWYARTLDGIAYTHDAGAANPRWIGWRVSIAYPEVGADEIWCQFDWIGNEEGTEAEPMSTFIKSMIRVKFGGTVKIKGPDTTTISPMVADKPMLVEAIGGLVQIEGQAARQAAGELAIEGFISPTPVMPLRHQ